jgi:hypothetical protein
LDVFLIKLDTDGNLVWWKILGGSLTDNVSGVIVDPAGNVVLGGLFTNTADFNPGLGSTQTFPLTSAGGSDAFVLKLTSDGDFVWARRWGGTGEDAIRDFALDAQGNVYSTGAYAGTVDFDPDPATTFNLTSQASFEIYVARLNSDGSFGWVVRDANLIDEHVSYSIRVDSGGSVYTSGDFRGTVDFGGSAATTLTSLGFKDVFLVKRNNSGVVQWARQYGGVQPELARGMDIDAANNVYITGQFASPLARFGDDVHTTLLSPIFNDDIFIQKVNDNGQHLATYQLGGNSMDRSAALAVDQLRGRIHVTGQFGGMADFDPGPAAFQLSSTGLFSMFLAQVAQGPQPLMTLSNLTVSENSGVQVVGNIAVTGLPQGTFAAMSVIGDPTGAFFIANGQLVADTSLLDFETMPKVEVMIRLNAASGARVDQLFTVQVLNNLERPIIAPLANASPAAGADFTQSGSFSDPDSSSWTATVNYGDGGGAFDHLFRCAGELNSDSFDEEGNWLM